MRVIRVRPQDGVDQASFDSFDQGNGSDPNGSAPVPASLSAAVRVANQSTGPGGSNDIGSSANSGGTGASTSMLVIANQSTGDIGSGANSGGTDASTSMLVPLWGGTPLEQYQSTAVVSSTDLSASVGAAQGLLPATNGIGPNGATPAQTRQALNAVGLNVTGQGLTVGVISDSFNNLGGAAQDEASGALPPAANVHVLKDLNSGGTDEGRAMMQIVHDIAPSANLDFYTADVSEQDFANGIIALANAGCKVICDDITYFDEPFFQTGVVANAIQTVEQEGVMYVTCAGNQAAAAYQNTWSNIASTTFDGHTLTNTFNFGNNNPVQTLSLVNAGGSSVPVLLEWNQPYGNITSSLALVVFSGGTYIGTFTNGGSGNPFVQVNLNSGFTYQIAIEDLSGAGTSSLTFKDAAYYDSTASNISLQFANAGTVFGHHMSPYAITVGAVDTKNTPAFGGTLQNENFSSTGLNTQLWFNFNGSPVANGPLHLSPLAVSGVDDINTTLTNGLKDFFGTSAATPSVAAVVADMLQANPALTFARIKQILEQTAQPFGDSNVAGASLVNALSAVNDATQLTADYFVAQESKTGDLVYGYVYDDFGKYTVGSTYTSATDQLGGTWTYTVNNVVSVTDAAHNNSYQFYNGRVYDQYYYDADRGSLYFTDFGYNGFANGAPTDQTNYSGANWLGSDIDYAMINGTQQLFGAGYYVPADPTLKQDNFTARESKTGDTIYGYVYDNNGMYHAGSTVSFNDQLGGTWTYTVNNVVAVTDAAHTNSYSFYNGRVYDQYYYDADRGSLYFTDFGYTGFVNGAPKDQTNYSGANWLGSDGDYAMINGHQQLFGFGTYVVGEGLPFGMSGSSDTLGGSSAASSSSDPQVAQMVQAMASFPSGGASPVTSPISDAQSQLTPPPLVVGQYGHG